MGGMRGRGGQKGEILIYIPDYLSAFPLMKSAAFYLLLIEKLCLFLLL
jgi:hypothetical protein